MSGRTRRSGVLVAPLLAIALALALALALAPAVPVEAARQAQRPRHAVGFRIEAGPKAMHNWIGSYRIGSGVGFRFQPGRRDAATAYRPVRLARHLGRNTHQVAYLLSEYGARRDRIQAAAVDAAVLALTWGGRFRVSGAVGSRRIQQIGPYAHWVRSYAKQMIADARRYAGPYRVQVRALDSTVGSSTRVQVSVRSARGRPMAGRRVTVRVQGSIWRGYTTGRGRAVATLTTTKAGPAVARVAVSGLPTSGIPVRRAVSRRASGVVVAGRFSTVRSRARFAVGGAQFVTVDPTRSTEFVPAGLGGSFEVAGGSGDRIATVSLFGPTAEPGVCAGTPVAVGEVLVSSAGSYPLPEVGVAVSGHYRWGVTVAGNEFTDPVGGCGDPVVVRSQAVVTQARVSPAGSRVALGEPFRISVTVSGFDRTEAHSVRSSLHGPFPTAEEATCDPGKELKARAQAVSVVRNQTRNQGEVVLTHPDRVGWYVWQSTLSDGMLIGGSTSSCGVRIHIVG